MPLTPEQETIEQIINRVRVASGVVGLSVTGLVERLRSDPAFIESLPTVIELRDWQAEVVSICLDHMPLDHATLSPIDAVRRVFKDSHALRGKITALESQLAEAQAQLGASEPVGYVGKYKVCNQRDNTGRISNLPEHTVGTDVFVYWKKPVIPQPSIAGKVPEGWKLVPIIMTDAMRDAGNIYTLNRSTLNRIWADMLSAAQIAEQEG